MCCSYHGMYEHGLFRPIRQEALQRTCFACCAPKSEEGLSATAVSPSKLNIAQVSIAVDREGGWQRNQAACHLHTKTNTSNPYGFTRKSRSSGKLILSRHHFRSEFMPCHVMSCTAYYIKVFSSKTAKTYKLTLPVLRVSPSAAAASTCASCLPAPAACPAANPARASFAGWPICPLLPV